MKYSMALLVAAILGGCAADPTRFDPPIATRYNRLPPEPDRTEIDDKHCKSYGAKVGSPAYVQCRMQQDNLHAQARIAQEQAQQQTDIARMQAQEAGKRAFLQSYMNNNRPPPTYNVNVCNPGGLQADTCSYR